MPAVYTVPVFNLNANIWRVATSPLDPPDVVTRAQLYVHSRVPVDVDPTSLAIFQPAVYLRVPIATDIQLLDLVEMEAGTGFFYRVRWVERIHLGFPNQYLAALLQQGTAVPNPLPPVGLLLEDETNILLEDGSIILLEF